MRNTLSILCIIAVSFLISSTPGYAQGRISAVVAPVKLDEAVEGGLPRAFSTATLRRELEIALEATQLFTVPTRDKHELDSVIDEVVLGRRHSLKAIAAQFIISPTVENVSLRERRRLAPHMRDRDAVSISGSMALRVLVINAATGAVSRRMSIDVQYSGPEHLEDPIDADGAMGQGAPGDRRNNARSREGGVGDFVALSQAVGRAFANRVVDQLNPTLVVARSGDQVYIGRGEDAGYRIGQTLRVFKRGQEIRNPATGEVLDRIDTEIGEVQVVEVRPKVTVTRIVRSTEEIGVSAIVREDVPVDQ